MRIGEKKLIQQIRRTAAHGPSVVKGIGDDCAVLRVPSGHEVLVTTDFSIEKVHFRRDWHSPELVGWRCLTRGLSDIAAMGGEPLAAFLSLAVAGDVPQKWVDRFLQGLLALARESGISLAGGDTAESAGGIQADIVVVGSVPRGTAVLRSGAKPRQAIYVTGELGGAAAELGLLRKSKGMGNLRRAFSRREPGITRPHARVAVGRWLRERGLASAMIDLSDGLSTDLDHICAESRVGAEIDAAAIPRALIGKEKVALELALHGGDDYELLFTSGAEVPAEIAGVRVTCIGRVGRFAGMRLILDGEARRLKPRGWEHFNGNR
ncbi:MAG TPA: thiamine-phosphate kinase [Terriglobales bacterium]|jgi:thiamine-monophosphate kinase|nr:thiamine-phosphate kinase [Terriglobales bacterium]